MRPAAHLKTMTCNCAWTADHSPQRSMTCQAGVVLEGWLGLCLKAGVVLEGLLTVGLEGWGGA
eukprot:2015204-Lingulodinium_polyedra.AAC.1